MQQIFFVCLRTLLPKEVQVAIIEISMMFARIRTSPWTRQQ